MEVRFRCKKCGSVYKGDSLKIKNLDVYLRCKTCDNNIYLLESVFAETSERAIESFAQLYLIGKTKGAKDAIYKSYMACGEWFTIDSEIRSVKVQIRNLLVIIREDTDWSWIVEKAHPRAIYSLCDQYGLNKHKICFEYLNNIKSLYLGMKYNNINIDRYTDILYAVDKAIENQKLERSVYKSLDWLSKNYLINVEDYVLALILALRDFDGKGEFYFKLRPYDLNLIMEFSELIDKVAKGVILHESSEVIDIVVDLKRLYSALCSLQDHLQSGLSAYSNTHANIFNMLSILYDNIAANPCNTRLLELTNDLRKCFWELMRLEMTLDSICIESESDVTASEGAKEVSGYQFEDDLSQLFAKLGFSVQRTPLSGDQGADLIVEKKGSRTVVQAKRYSGKVTNKAVQEIFAAKTFYNADRAIVVTNSVFTKSAIELAISNGVELWDGGKLEEIRSVVK